jgi:hypothetical protein
MRTAKCDIPIAQGARERAIAILGPVHANWTTLSVRGAIESVQNCTDPWVQERMVTPLGRGQRCQANRPKCIRFDGRRTVKAYILALTLGFALAGTGLMLTRQLPATLAACIDRGC